MTKLVEEFHRQLRERLHVFFRDQAEGWDIPPAQLYRLEGFIEAGLSLQLVSQDEVRQQLLSLATDYLPEEDAELYQQDDRIVLHLHMKTAPVYPSTSST